MNNRRTGEDGESQISQYLTGKGYNILHRNFRYKKKEVDIIARKGDTVVFVEVKKRSTNLYGRGVEAVDHAKRNNIICAAKAYINRYRCEDLYVRFDVASIDEGRISYIEDAFQLQ